MVEAARLQLPIMQDHLRGEAGQQTYRLAQILNLGNHELELLIHKNATGVAIVEPNFLLRSPTTKQASTFKWWWWVAAAAVALYFFAGPQTSEPSYQPSMSTPYRPSTRTTDQPSTPRTYQPTTRTVPLQSDTRLPAPPLIRVGAITS